MKTAVLDAKADAKRNVWQLQEAKAMLSELIKSSAREPQFITVWGEEKAVVLSMEEYRSRKPGMSLSAFFRASPWADVELELPERRVEPARKIDL
jgi:prevent-host-death family protein